MRIRTAALEDLAAVTAVEAACFPAAEAATRDEFAARLAVYPNHFWLLEEDGRLVIELHIKVTFGLNIAAIVRSITHKVKYAVEDATGLKVQRIDVCVDDIV